MQPKPGEIWKHFKGTSYHIMAVSGNPLVPSYPPHYWAKHTETEETLAVYHHLSAESAATLTKSDGLTVITQPHVLYFSSLTSGLVWARPLDNFLEVVDRGGEQVARFRRMSGRPMNCDYWERGEYLVSGLVGGILGVYLYGDATLGALVGIPVGVFGGWTARVIFKQ